MAILLVLSGHSIAAYLPAWHGFARPIVGNSTFGVRLFFALSGFLITSLLLKEQQQYGRIDLKRFFIRRSIRIFPALYLFIFVVAALSLLGWIDVSGQQIFAAATQTWNYSALWIQHKPQDGRWFLGHLWTLSLEEQFYVFWPSLIVLLGWKRVRHLAWLLPLVIPLFRIVSYFIIPSHRGYENVMFHTACDSILIGCAFAIWKTPLLRLLANSYLRAAAVATFVFILSPLLAANIRTYGVTVGSGLDSVGAGFLILAACQLPGLTVTLSVPILTWLGRLSYSLYLWQQLFLTGLNTHWSGSFPVSLVCSLVAGLTLYYLIELPVLRLKKPFERAHLDPQHDGATRSTGVKP
ncbi:acyltransferase [bacterium]|nr:acyltransferase [bacterium]